MKIKKNDIIDFLVLLSFAYFPSFIMAGVRGKIFTAYCLMVYILIILNYISKNKNNIPSITYIIAIMYTIPLIPTIIYKNYDVIDTGIKVLLGAIALSLLIKDNLTKKPKEFLKKCMIFWGILVCINIACFFLYYPAMDPNLKNFYFLGNDNGSVYETLLFLFLSILYYTNYTKKIPMRFIILLLYIFAGYIYVNSGNGKVCTFLVLAYVLIYGKNKKISKVLNKITNYKTIVIIYLIIFFSLVVFKNKSIIIDTVLDILKKDKTFTGRTGIWELSFKYIKEHILLGNGYENDIILINKIHQVKAHNLIIQFLYNGGVLMILCLIDIIKKVFNKTKNSPLRIKSLISLFLLIYFIISIFDYYWYKFNLLFFLLTMFYFEDYKQFVRRDEV